MSKKVRQKLSPNTAIKSNKSYSQMLTNIKLSEKSRQYMVSVKSRRAIAKTRERPEDSPYKNREWGNFSIEFDNNNFYLDLEESPFSASPFNFPLKIMDSWSLTENWSQDFSNIAKYSAINWRSKVAENSIR